MSRRSNDLGYTEVVSRPRRGAKMSKAGESSSDSKAVEREDKEINARAYQDNGDSFMPQGNEY